MKGRRARERSIKRRRLAQQERRLVQLIQADNPASHPCWSHACNYAALLLEEEELSGQEQDSLDALYQIILWVKREATHDPDTEVDMRLLRRYYTMLKEWQERETNEVNPKLRKAYRDMYR